ncbi:MAG: hypothetical protein ACOYBP_08925 [Microbacteriaceae bacterium]
MIKNTPFFSIREIEYTPFKRQLEHVYALGNPFPYAIAEGNIELPQVRVKFILEGAREALLLLAEDVTAPLDIDCFYVATAKSPAHHDRLEGLRLMESSALSVVHSSTAPLELDLMFLPTRILFENAAGVKIDFTTGIDLPSQAGV